MSCPQCQGLENLFDKTVASSELKDYRRKGPPRQTRVLVDVLRQADPNGLTLLDIGGGVGAIQHELIKAGVRSAVDVDASSAYIAAAREEATQQGYVERVQYLHGDFVELASQVEQADIVTLDRVICCYPDMHSLVSLSAARAGKLYALIFPRDSWWIKIGAVVLNLATSLRRTPFRFFVHSSAEVDAIVGENGLQPRFRRRSGLMWQVVVYARPD
jgi:SAM-dependent methyltransferase